MNPHTCTSINIQNLHAHAHAQHMNTHENGKRKHNILESGMVTHTYNPSIPEAKAKTSLWYIVRS